METDTFIRWMNRIAPGFYSAVFNCHNWMVNRVLVTLWHRTGIVKIYHGYIYRNGIAGTEWHPYYTEQCREAIMNLCK